MVKRTKIHKLEKQMVVKGFTVTSLAEETGLSTLTIREILYCKRLPSPKTSSLIAMALKMDVEDLRAALYDAQQQSA